MFKGRALLENIILIYLSVVLPFSFLSTTIDPTHAVRLLTLGVTVFVGFLVLFSAKSEELKAVLKNVSLNSRVKLLFVGYLIFCLLSGVKASSSTSFLFELMKQISYFMFLVLILELVKEKSFLTKIFRSVTIFTAVGIAVGIYQYFTVPELDQLSSLFANKNLFASILLLCFPFVLISFWQDDNKVVKGFALLILLLVLSFIIVLKTRAVWVGFVFLSTLLASGYLYVMKVVKPKVLFSSLLVCFLALIGFGVLKSERYFEIDKIDIKHSDVSTINRPSYVKHVGSFESRLELNKSTVEIVMDNLLLGVGLGNWKIAYPKYGLSQYKREVQLGKVNYQRAHNDWLQLLSEVGVLGWLCFLSVFVLVFIQGFQALNKNPFVIIVMLAALFSFAIVMLLDFPRERVEHNVLMILIIAIILSFVPDSVGKRVVNPKIIAGVFCLLAVLGVTASSNQINGERNMRFIEQYHKQSRWTELTKLVGETKSIYDINPYSIPTVWYGGVASFSTQRYSQAWTEFKDAESIHPYNVNVLNNIASTYYQLGKKDSATMYYDKVLQISPYYDEALINKTIIQFNAGKLLEALNTISLCYIGTTHPNYEKVLLAVLKSVIKNHQKAHPHYYGQMNRSFTDDATIRKIYNRLYSDGVNFQDYLNTKYSS